MAKLKLAKGPRKSAPKNPMGISCVILVFSAMALVMFFLYFVLKNANG
jgi:hypothetical protein